jgi:hypothetical protein
MAVIAIQIPGGFGDRWMAPRSGAAYRARSGCGNAGGDGQRAAFHRAYLHATQQAFLEAHEHAFAYFGVFTCCIMII